MTELSDLLNQAKGESSVDDLIAAAEKRLGHTINQTFRSTIYKALDGDHAKNPRESTLQGFADVFRLDVRDLRIAAGKPAGELGAWTPTPEAARLSRDQRAALDRLIKTIVQGGQAHGNAAPTTRPGGPDGSPVTDLSERRSTVKRPPAERGVANRTRRPNKRRGDDD